MAPEPVPTGNLVRIGKYEILDVLGRGGMGVVYRAIDKHIGREVAIKTLTEGFAGDTTMLERFYEEGRRTGRLNHPNIVTVYDLGDDNGMPYIVMECVAGETLEAILRSGRALPLADGLQIVAEMCSALGYAHLNKVIHRDVKPANIFVQPDGKAKLLDFGIARLEKREADQNLTRTGHLIGTVGYMAPERLRGEVLDGRSDIFSAGIVLYQMIAGQRPFTGTDNLVMQRILTEPHPPLHTVAPDCPAALQQIVDRALAKPLDDRYASAEEMAADLATVIAGLRCEQAGELMVQARRLVEEKDFGRARTALHQLLKIDSKHTAARELLSEVHQYFALRKREERMSELLQQIEAHFTARQYEQALLSLESNQDLLAPHPEFETMLTVAKCGKEKQDRIGQQLGLVETARRKGDYAAAIAAAQKALALDESNSKIYALCNLLTKEAGQAQRAAQLRALLNSARGEIGSRHYHEAIELLKQVEQIDPTNSELILLQQDANSGLEQARQREVVARLEERVAVATNTEEIRQVAQDIQEAMTAHPSESAFYRLNAQVERLAREQENRRVVEDAVRACRDLPLRAALDVVQKARQRLPADQQLLSVEAMLSDRLRQQSVDERRSDYMTRARQSLNQQQYAEAIRLLEFCQAEGIASEEVVNLLEFARREEREVNQQHQLHNHLAEAQSLLAAMDFEAAIAYLEEALGHAEDPALRMLLDQATAGRLAQQQQVANALTAAIGLQSSGKIDEAIRFLRMQPPAIQQATRVGAILEVLEEERRQAVYRCMGRAYATLQGDPASSSAQMRKATAAAADHRFTTALSTHYRARQNDLADRAIKEAVQSAKELIRTRDKAGAGDRLRAVARLTPFASASVKLEWERIANKVAVPAVAIAKIS
jgi:serine/threonine-protein kinase